MDVFLISALVAYLAFGALIGFAVAESFDLSVPRWVAIPLIAAFWPLALVFIFLALLRWMASGSH